ncbi:hypothetical protein KCP75_23770 [Salmonella enterica subsp. enterica]|nr:hypothetical protein KCP75_23770 [Salmonella enterica subsp. enterica]
MMSNTTAGEPYFEDPNGEEVMTTIMSMRMTTACVTKAASMTARQRLLSYFLTGYV